MRITLHHLTASMLVVLVAAAAAPAQSRSDGGDAASAAATRAGTPEAEVAADAYRLGPGDRLRVEVYRDQQLSQSLQVRPDGQITLPLVGDITASGFTPLELRDRITTALEEYVTEPVVTVIVVEANANVAYVMGEVNRPGSIGLQGPTTVLQALAMAGGFREWANTRNIRILRRNEGNGRVEFLNFNYRESLQGREPFLYLQSGDVVVVP